LSCSRAAQLLALYSELNVARQQGEFT